MRLPSMKHTSGIRKVQQVKFGGMAHSIGAGDGSLWDMKNLCSDHSPVLATRGKRWKVRTLSNPGGMYGYEKLCWVENGKFYYDGAEKGEVSQGQKNFGSLGSCIVILPDKKYYNKDTDTFGSMESSWAGGSLTFGNGKLYGEDAVANCIQCEGVNWGESFKAGDAVTIAGCTQQPGNNKSIIIRQVDGDKLYFYEYSFTIPAGEGETPATSYTETGALSISRKMPDIKWCCENDNRLWGCDDKSIYASKPGDIFNWNVFDVLESDAWAVTPGGTGEFTGCIAYRGYPVFFKEDKIYKVYGDIPSNFQAVSSASLGLAEGSHGSLAIAGETLFYQSRSGMMAYTGGIPQSVTAAFGIEKYRMGVAGSDGLKYYISMRSEDGTWALFVYDTQRGCWHREDETRATHFAYLEGNLYCLNEQGEIWILGNGSEIPEGAEPEGEMAWMAEFTDFTDSSPNKKGMTKLQIRLELGEDARMEALVQFDSDGIWHSVKELCGSEAKRSQYLPITPRRCDHYRLKLQGVGECRIYSLVREVYAGSESQSRK